MTDLNTEMKQLAFNARQAARQMQTVSTAKKNEALQFMTEALVKDRAAIEAANAEDLAKGKEKGLAGPMLDRLRMDARVIEKLVEGLHQVSKLEDPVGQELSKTT